MVSVNEATLAALDRANGTDREAESDALKLFDWENKDLEQQIVAYVLEHHDKPFMAQLLPYLKPDLFRDPVGYGLMKHIHEEHAKQGTIPTRGLIKQAMGKSLTADDVELYESSVAWLNVKPNPKCYNYLTKELVDDLKYRAYRQTAYDSELHDLLTNREYAKLDRLFSNCFPTLDCDNDTIDLKDDLDAILSLDHIQSIGIGFPALDGVMHDKGAARGEILVFLANTGVGKTTLLLNCARHAERKGLKVLYIVLEGTKKAVSQRMGSIYVDCPTKTVHEHAEAIRRVLSQSEGEIRFVQPMDEVWTTINIAKRVEHLRTTEGWVPDVICVDYAKLLKPSEISKSDPEYIRQSRIMDELKKLALNTNSLLLTAQQANRDGEGEAVIGLKQAAGSYDAMQPCDYVVSVNQTAAEEMRGDMRLLINKNRHGPESVTCHCHINRASGLCQER